jgi:hypothetical protein
VNFRLDLRLCVLGIRLRPNRAADVVDQDVYPAEVLSRTVYRGGGTGKGLKVGDNSDRFGAGGFGLVPDLLDQRRTIDQRESAAFARNAECRGPADPLCRARYDGDLAGKAPWKDDRCLMPLAQM